MDEKVTKTDAQWKTILTAEQYEVARKKGTEPPGSGKYEHHKAHGTYKCVCCGNPLFSSESKYDSGSGWPSFREPIRKDAVSYEKDNTLLTPRVEILCSQCDAHLGHVFPDGPPPSGQRYCTNSASLNFEPAEDRVG